MKISKLTLSTLYAAVVGIKQVTAKVRVEIDCRHPHTSEETTPEGNVKVHYYNGRGNRIYWQALGQPANCPDHYIASVEGTSNCAKVFGEDYGAKTDWNDGPYTCLPPYIAVANLSGNEFLIDRMRLCHDTGGCFTDASWGADKGNGWCVSNDTGDTFKNRDLDADCYKGILFKIKASDYGSVSICNGGSYISSSARAFGCSQHDCCDNSEIEECSDLAADLKDFGEYLQVDVNLEDGNPYLRTGAAGIN